MDTHSQSSANPTAAFSLDQAATELGTEPVSVLRLIARGVLPAAMVGDKYRLTPSAVTDYVGRGAPDFKSLDTSRTWFEVNMRQAVVELKRNLQEAAKDQRPTDDQLRGAKDGTIARPELTFVVKRSAAIVEAAERTLEEANKYLAMFKNRDAKNTKKETLSLLDLFIADELHSKVKVQLNRRGDIRPLFLQFYESPEKYKAITAAAAEKVAQESIRWHRREVIEVGPNDPPQKSVLVHYVIGIDSLSTRPIAARIRDVIAMAF